MGTNGKGIKVIAITGPSASGKSVLAKHLFKALGRDSCVVLCQDDYYKNWSHLPKEKRKKINFDDANSFDFELLCKHLRALSRRASINKPCYSFVESKRLTKGQKICPKPIVILEGLTPLFNKELRRLIDLKIYIDVDCATSLSRRLKRDMTERAETIESVCERYFNDVLPMQRRYVERQKKWADVVVDGKALDKKVVRKIVRLL